MAGGGGQAIPAKQVALELVAAGRLRLNRAKAVGPVGLEQVLLRVEAVGLCHSDLKLVHAFGEHPRKKPVVAGPAAEVLGEIASYRPGELSTVPGHEAACTVAAVGAKVRGHWVGQRVLVQTDYRWLRTEGSNATFGYNFEGGLQQYVLADQRVFTEPETGRSLLLAAPEGVGHSAVALVEPWACVECSYRSEERRGWLAGGRVLVVREAGCEERGLEGCAGDARPGVVERVRAENVEGAMKETWDDVVYFGSRAEVVETLAERLGAGGMLNVVLGGKRLGRAISLPLGWIHYAQVRFVGALGMNAAAGYEMIPETGEVATGERVLIVGAGGPMGQMHVLRAVLSGKSLQVTASEQDAGRSEALAAKCVAVAEREGARLEVVEAGTWEGSYDYVVVLVTAPKAVTEAVASARRGARINLFGGIPAQVRYRVDYDGLIEKECYVFGTSGSRVDDMEAVLAQIRTGRLDTNLSVDAVSGMAGAKEAMAALGANRWPGKIVVYPRLEKMELWSVGALGEKYPTVRTALARGSWTARAEAALLRIEG